MTPYKKESGQQLRIQQAGKDLVIIQKFYKVTSFLVHRLFLSSRSIYIKYFSLTRTVLYLLRALRHLAFSKSRKEADSRFYI